jgi:hypothetical protein
LYRQCADERHPDETTHQPKRLEQTLAGSEDDRPRYQQRFAGTDVERNEQDHERQHGEDRQERSEHPRNPTLKTPAAMTPRTTSHAPANDTGRKNQMHRSIINNSFARGSNR